MTAFNDIVLETIKLLRQVYGTSVQTYSEPLVESFVNKAFRFCHSKNFWIPYTREADYVLNGTTGLITTNLRQSADEIIEFGDIKTVFPDNGRRPLTRKPDNLRTGDLTGTTPLYIVPLNSEHASYATKVFKIVPITATGTITIVNRFRPKANFIDTDQIYLNEDMLVYAAVYFYLKDDGAVPDMVDSYKELFDVRYRDAVKMEQSTQPIQLRNRDVYPSRRGSVTEWQ